MEDVHYLAQRTEIAGMAEYWYQDFGSGYKR